jgi:hypothetical protein
MPRRRTTRTDGTCDQDRPLRQKLYPYNCEKLWAAGSVTVTSLGTVFGVTPATLKKLYQEIGKGFNWYG